AEGARHDHFLDVLVLPGYGCAKAAIRIGPWGFPSFLARAQVNGQERRTLVAIAADHNQVASDQRRGGCAVATQAQGDRQRMAPQFIPFMVVADQPVRTEVTHDSFTIERWR